MLLNTHTVFVFAYVCLKKNYIIRHQISRRKNMAFFASYSRLFYKQLNKNVCQRLMSTSLTTIQFNNGVKKITMCNQKTRNALSLAMMNELLEHITSEQEDPKIRAVVIGAEGPVFSAGHNLKELTPENGPLQQEEVFKLCAKLMNAIIDCPVPVIAKVDGLATAAGCQLVAQCDIALCSEKSTFSTPGANFGIFCSTPGIALARCVPKATAAHMLLTGLPIDSSEAKANGLVFKVCPSEKLDEEVDAICAAISTKSRSVIELGKKFFYKQKEKGIREAYDLGASKMTENLNLIDGKEGVKSFVEKRKPNWSHSFF